MALKYLIVIIAILFSFVNCDKYLKERPSFLKICHTTDADFGKCLAANYQTAFSEWRDGIPGLANVGKLDPLHVKRVKIVQEGARTLSLNMDLQNVIITGISKATVKECRLDMKAWTVVCSVYLPKLLFASDYKVKGQVLALPLNSAGTSTFQSDNLQMLITVHLKLRDSGDFTFTEIEKGNAVIKEIGNFHCHINNLFNGQKDLEDAANDLFNDNWRLLYEALRPAIEQTVGKVLEDRLKKVFHFVPANYYIEDIPKASTVYG